MRKGGAKMFEVYEKPTIIHISSEDLIAAKLVCGSGCTCTCNHTCSCTAMCDNQTRR